MAAVEEKERQDKLRQQKIKEDEERIRKKYVTAKSFQKYHSNSESTNMAEKTEKLQMLLNISPNLANIVGTKRKNRCPGRK